MGEVWKAWDLQLHRWVAIKELHAPSEAARTRLQREALTVARLSHPNIVTVFDVGLHEGLPFIAMEFIDGKTLGVGAPFPPRESAEFIRDAARAVAYSHREGIIHRDIKPQNLMVDSTGRLRVTDFGLARPVESGESITLPGTPLGTPAYMSPEQASAAECSERSDIYSLGATLYHLLTGRPPFESKTVFETLKRVQEEDPPLPRSLAPALPMDLERVVLKAMERDAPRRYPSAEELAADLDRWLRGEAVLANPPSRLRRFLRSLKRHPALTSAVLVAGLTLLAGGAYAGFRYATARGLGEEGIEFARQGRLNEARGRLDRSIATWKIERYAMELERVVGELARRTRSERLGLLYDELGGILDKELQRIEDLAHGGPPADAEERGRILHRVEAEIDRIPASWRDSSLPYAMRGWVLCNLGEVARGESELERAMTFVAGDPYGRIVWVRWKIRKQYLRLDPRTLSRPPGLPEGLVDELNRLSQSMLPHPSAALNRPPIGGANHRDFIHALSAVASGRDSEAVRLIDSFRSATRLRAEALLFRGLTRALTVGGREAVAALDDALEAHPRCSLAWWWRAEVLLRMGSAEAARASLRTALEHAGMSSAAIRKRLEELGWTPK